MKGKKLGRGFIPRMGMGTIYETDDPTQVAVVLDRANGFEDVTVSRNLVEWRRS